MDLYQQYIYKSRYARYRDELGRREEWSETVKRYIDFFFNKYGYHEGINWLELEKAILNLEVMPSMRTMMTAGKALDIDNVAGYNCAYLTIDDVVSFDETMYILMCGTGVGFSVERKYVQKLPEIGSNRGLYRLTKSEYFPGVDPSELSILDKKKNEIIVHDSKTGWASAFRILLIQLYNSNFNISWDLSNLRPAGARLFTFGGVSSGPEPLHRLFLFSRQIFREAAGRRLTTLECHDLMCKVAEIVVVGGVRRSALLSLSDLSDNRMAKAKAGNWYNENPQRALANNSISYTEKPDMLSFLKEWYNLYESRSGERGIFSRQAANKKARSTGRRSENDDFGCNPCSEIILRPNQFCNLSEVVIRENDDSVDLERKVRIASILGTLQATLTNFRYLRPIWKQNTEEESLLGVSLTGIMDNLMMSSILPINLLQKLRETSIEINKKYSQILGINQSVSNTCIKPSGTVSQLVNSSSGIHPRFADYYIRRVRQDKKDKLADFLVSKGMEPEEDRMNPSAWVFSFPIQSPLSSKKQKNISAMEQLRVWKTYQDHYCEHKPSQTVYYRPDEFLEVGAWVYNNLDDISGISFFPVTDHIYEQSPYEEITKEEYEEMVSKLPEINWKDFEEKQDNTAAAKELACSGGACEL